MGDDGGPQLPPPKHQVPPLFVGACIYANIPHKQHRSVDIVGGEGPHDSLQVYLVVHPIAFWIDQSCGKMIVVVGLSIQTGNICWWSRPYAPGKWNNLSIIRDLLVSMLNAGGKVRDG
jgi:hypothetical protein